MAGTHLLSTLHLAGWGRGWPDGRRRLRIAPAQWTVRPWGWTQKTGTGSRLKREADSGLEESFHIGPGKNRHHQRGVVTLYSIVSLPLCNLCRSLVHVFAPEAALVRP